MSTLPCIIALGNSITGSASCYPFPAFGITSRGDSSTAYRQSLAEYNVPGVGLFKNLAVSGTRLSSNTDNIISVAQTYLYPSLAARAVGPLRGSGGAARPTRKFIVSILPASNDGCLGGRLSVDDYINLDVLPFCAALMDHGASGIIIGTELPRNELGGPMTNTNRLAYNASVRTPGFGHSSGIVGVFDFGAHPIMGDVASCDDTNIYLDHIHPSPVSHSTYLAPIWRPVVDTALAAL